MDKETKQVFIMGTISFLVVCIINIFMYKFLPEHLNLNFFNDKVTIKKELFLLIMPLICIIGNCISRSKLNSILFNLLMPILNIIVNIYSK